MSAYIEENIGDRSRTQLEVDKQVIIARIKKVKTRDDLEDLLEALSTIAAMEAL